MIVGPELDAALSGLVSPESAELALTRTRSRRALAASLVAVLRALVLLAVAFAAPCLALRAAVACIALVRLVRGLGAVREAHGFVMLQHRAAQLVRAALSTGRP